MLEQSIGYPADYLHYHQGWFQDTLPEQHKELDRIAMLRLDADWYASTKLCLDHFFYSVVAGGFVIIDDYGAYDGCRKAVDEFLAKTGNPFFLNVVNETIRYICIS